MACWLVACLVYIPFAGSAATFSSTPASVTSGSTNAVVLSVGGLVSQQQVRIELFRDANGNGVVDPGDDLVLSFNAADGEVSPIPADSGVGSAGDDDGATNGQVRKVLTLAILPEVVRTIGAYVFKVSAVDSSFAPLTQPFTISAGVYAQAVDGRVLAGGVPVPSAMVALLSMVGDDDVELITAVLSDGAGHFNLKAAPGDYMLLAIKQGYVADMANAPGTSLMSGVNSTQDVMLVSASSSISGRVIDELTSNGIPGLQLFLESPDGFITMVVSSATGDFSAPVTPAAWKVSPSERATALAGYGKATLHVDTTGGAATNLQLKLSRSLGSFGLVFFYPDGGFGNGTNGLLSFPTRLKYFFALYNIQGADFPTNVLFTGPVGSGLSSTPSVNGSSGGDSAYYSSPQFEVSPYPPGGQYEVNYNGRPQRFMLADPDAQNRQVCLLPTVVLNPAGELTEIRWSYRDVNGSLMSAPAYLARIEVRVDGIGGQIYNGDATPGATNHAVNSPIAWTNVTSLQMVYDDTDGNQYVTFWRTGSQPLENVSGSIPAATLGTSYHFQFVAAGGQTPYSWSKLSGTLPPGLNFSPVAGEITGTPTAGGSYPFTVRVTDNNGHMVDASYSLVVNGGVAARLELRPAPGPGQFALRLVGEAGRSYSLEYSTTLTNWFTLLTTNTTGTNLDLVDTTATNRNRFYRVRLNP